VAHVVHPPTTSGFDDLDTEKLCEQLANLSLLSSYDLSTHSIRLHGVIRNYLQTKMRTQLPILHQQFLDTYNLPCWADLPAKEPYLWEHLTEHLLGAEKTKELIPTSQSPHISTPVVSQTNTTSAPPPPIDEPRAHKVQD